MKPLEVVESSSPVFFKVDDAPKGVTVQDICEAAERKVGHGNIAGAVRNGAVWRLHGKTPEDKASLLAGEPHIYIRKMNTDKKMESHKIPLYSKNPSNSNIVDGKVVPSVKLVINGFYLSVSMTDVKKSLEKIPGLKMRSKVFYDRAWMSDGSLSRWVNGRRYVFIDEPSESSPLPATLRVGAFQAYLSYKGMPVKCWDCAGQHKKGDPDCPKVKDPNWTVVCWDCAGPHKGGGIRSALKS